VFRSRFLSEDVIVLAGPEGWAHFGDPASVTREQAQFPFIRRLLGGKNMGMVDGTEHRMVRSLVATAFTDEALAAYMPTMQALVHDALRLWAQEGEAAWIDGLQRLTLRTISATMVGAQPEEQEDAMLSTYRLLMRGGLSLPVPLPLTRYGRAVRSVERILGSYGPIVAEHRARPRDDGLTRMLAAEREGRRLTDSEAAHELHHVAAAGFGTYALLGGLVTLMGRHPEIREHVREEVLHAAPEGVVTPALLREMPQLRQSVLEAKRVWPLFPILLGRARRALTVAGYDIPPAHLLVLAVYPSNCWPDVYDAPSTFDPERFSPARSEHERHRFGYAPHGAGPHRCLGEDFTTYLCSAFMLLLLRGYNWDLVDPAAELLRDRAVPEPRDGLRVRLEARSG
jgi:cytochrome P450